MLLLIPHNMWDRIASKQWSILMILLFSFLPFLALSTFVEGFGMLYLGTSVNDYGRTHKINQQQVIQFQAVQVGISLLVLFLGTKLVLWVCEGFHSPVTYRQAFTLTAYGITPLLWLRICDGAPAMPTWVCFAIGAVGVFYVMYHGIAFILEPDTSVGFGLYLICSLVLVLLAGLAHFVVQIVAQRKFDFVASLFSEQSFVVVGKLF